MTESIKEGLESLLNIATEKILNDDFKRLDLCTNEARISIYKVTEKLVRIDIKIEK